MTESVTVHHGDSRDVLAAMEPDTLAACVTDPPYALESIRKRFGGKSTAAKGRYFKNLSRGFMGQQWDTGDVAFDPEFWALVYRVLKPGGWLLAFGGTRTYHRLACAIEDSGFEVRDMFAWLYGSGMPKTSKDVARAIARELGVDDPPEAEEWEGWGTAVKPALEPICVARKPLSERTMARNVLVHRTGGLHIAANRIGVERVKTQAKAQGESWGQGIGQAGFKGVEESPERAGRWPANVQHDGSPEVTDAFPQQDGTESRPIKRSAKPERADGYRHDALRETWGQSFDDPGGSAARFFYSAKADGLDRLGSDHPTVKPVDLIRHYVALVTPPGETVLDPFAGSGTCGLAALAAGRRAVLIEREAAYYETILRRLAWARGEGRLTALESARGLDPGEASGDDLPLFAAGV